MVLSGLTAVEKTAPSSCLTTESPVWPECCPLRLVSLTTPTLDHNDKYQCLLS